MSAPRYPTDVGIIALEVYFPPLFVDQRDLEAYDGVSAGKYTVGLGQTQMGFCDDREDINSLCLTVVDRLVRNAGVDYTEIGRLEVGTETIIDKSKSVKSVLMTLFEDSGNYSVEGVDTTNACYGGTSALFNTVHWIESSYWDGRYGLVVAGDIAVYSEGPARPTGGAGAVAMLIGSNAPVVLDRGLRGTYMRHVYDFYKPDLTSEYPVVDGPLTIKCYLSALDYCYRDYRLAYENRHGGRFSLLGADAVVFHTPFSKLVQKSIARLFLNDFLADPGLFGADPKLEKYSRVRLEDSYFDKDMERCLMEASLDLFNAKTLPSLLLAKRVGNMYAPSVYASLASHIHGTELGSLPGSRMVLFSYGSGLASSMFSVTFRAGARLERMKASLEHITRTLDSRTRQTPEDYSNIMATRRSIHNQAGYLPTGILELLSNDCWYLISVDEKRRRYYKCKRS